MRWLEHAEAWINAHRLAIGASMATLVLVLLVWDQSYAGRRDVAFATVKAQRQGCKRGMHDRFDDLEDWYAAYRARRHAAELAHEPPGGPDASSAATYLVGIRDKMLRVDAAHSLVWPDPRTSGAHGPFAHPFGLGRFDCARAYPMPHVSFFHFG